MNEESNSRSEDPRQTRLRELLSEAREELGLSQAALAEAIGRDQAQISRIEKGTRDISVVEYLDLCIALHRDPLKLLQRIRRAKGASAKERPPGPGKGPGGGQ